MPTRAKIWMAVILLAVAGLVVLIVPKFFREKPPTAEAPSYEGRRSRVLALKDSDISLAAEDYVDGVWGVVADLREGKSTATIVAIGDGSASVYYSDGGGRLGAGDSTPAVAGLAKKLVRAAGERKDLGPASVFPLPADGQMSVYVLTKSGVKTGPPAPLEAAVRALLEEIRKR